MDKKGAFITLEGCEGVGKSTQLRALEKYLLSTGREVVVTREPGGTPLAEKIRDLILHCDMDALTEATLFASARIDHAKNLIMPAVNRGAIVLCDRYIDSSFAYQAYARGLGLEAVKKINSFALNNCMPDLTLFLNMSPDNTFRAKSGKVILDDRLEQEDLSFHMAVYEGFLALAKTENRIVSVLPAEDKEETAKRIQKAVEDSGVLQ